MMKDTAKFDTGNTAYLHYFQNSLGAFIHKLYMIH